MDGSLSLCGTLYPLSSSALYSARCHSGVTRAKVETRPNTPESDSGNGPGTIYSRGREDTESCHTWAPDVKVELILSNDTPNFSLGSNDDSYLTLRHAAEVAETDCWFQLIHCLLCPDPDSDHMWIYNESSSNFYVQSYDHGPIDGRKLVKPSNSYRIPVGHWRLNLGVGLEFRLTILTRPGAMLPVDVELRDSGSGLSGSNRCGFSASTRKVSRHKLKELSSQALKRTLSITGCDPGSRKSTTSAPSATSAMWSSKEDLDPVVPIQQVEQHIATTKNSSVRLVAHGSTFVAVKSVRKEQVVSAGWMWSAEVNALQWIRGNPNVVKLIGSSARDLTLMLEYVPGKDLSRMIDGKTQMSLLSDNDLATVLDGAVKAIENVHSQGYIHNDVKPDNLVFDRDRGRVVLIDFGVACRAGKEGDGAYGTPCYVPPEFLLREYGKPRDIFALGVVMAFLAKQIPLPNGSWRIAESRVNSNGAWEQYMLWQAKLREVAERLPSHLRLIGRMLHSNPLARITSSELLKEVPKFREAQIKHHEGLILTC